MSYEVLLTGATIFLARICDVSMGTIRTISTVQGRSVLAFFMGLIEVTIWVLVVTTVVQKIGSSPLLVVFYAFGFATGNVLGIILERKIALGFLVVRAVTRKAGKRMAERIREKGQRVTTFLGEGMYGPVTELYIVCRRKELGWILDVIKEEDPEAFYITEHANAVSTPVQPNILQPATGWRSVLKKK